MLGKSYRFLSTLLAGWGAASGALAFDSFSEIDFGLDHIKYQENLTDVGHLKERGHLRQSVAVTNPTIRNVSYSGLSDNWGLFIRGSSTLATSVEDEQWRLGEFGIIQKDDYKLKFSDISLSVAYSLASNVLVVAGGDFTTYSFTRSNFTHVEPGATAFSKAISPGKFEVIAGAINEDQYAFLTNVGVRYDTRLGHSSDRLSYYAQADMLLPVYTMVQNTTIAGKSLTDSLNGWGVSAVAGLRFSLTRKLAIKAGVNALYGERDEIIYVQNDNRMRVPNIRLTTLGFGLGISWAY